MKRILISAILAQQTKLLCLLKLLRHNVDYQKGDYLTTMGKAYTGDWFYKYREMQELPAGMELVD
jgi:hypothetical protein